jgi:hypothetical protein
MARNGSGTFSSPYPNFVSGTVISSTQVDANNSDIATALTQSIAVDGQSTVTGNIPLSTYKLTGVGAGSAATDSLTLGQAQAEAMHWCGTAGGTADAITLAPTPAITAYAAGQRFVWKASGSVNTGATTVAISGLGAIALQDSGAALVAGDHAVGKIYMGILDTASTVQIINVQVSSINPLRVTSLVVSGIATVGGITTTTSGTSNLVAGVNAGNSIASGGNYNTLIGDEAGTTVSTGDNNVAVGYAALDANNTGASNVAVGNNALGVATTASGNTAVGVNAGDAILTGYHNVALGGFALSTNISGAQNVAIGYEALFNNTASNNTAVGHDAAKANTSGIGITAVGYLALTANTTGNYNTACGYAALDSNTEGVNNTAVGSAAMTLNTTGSHNAAVGLNTLDANTSGLGNVAMGHVALGLNETGDYNVAIGYAALDASVGADVNTAVGLYSLSTNTTGTFNTAIGAYSGNLITEGDYNTSLGYNAQPTGATADGEFTLGNGNVSTLRCNDTSISSLSDSRDKTDVIDSPYGLDFINTVRPVQFKWETRDGNVKDGSTRVGFLAQELLAACEGNNGVLDLVLENNPERLEAKQANLLPIMVQAIKELSAKVTELEEKLNV